MRMLFALLGMLCTFAVTSANFPEPCVNENLGCFADHRWRGIKGGIRFKSSDRNNLIRLCQGFAMQNGWRYFAIESEDECWTAADAEATYYKHEKLSDRACSEDGLGGSWKMNMYKITCDDDASYKPIDESYSIEHYGCWGDHPNYRIFNERISGKVDFKNSGDIKIIDLCKAWAVTKGFDYFGVESDDECWTANNAVRKYDLRGGESTCSSGKGGDWGMDVYRITQDGVEQNPKYSKYLYDVNECRQWGKLSQSQCREAAEYYGYDFGLTTIELAPQYCIQYQDKKRFTFNRIQNGHSPRNINFTPVCRYECPLKHLGCYVHDENDNAENQYALDKYKNFSQTAIGTPGVLGRKSTCSRIAMDQGKSLFGIRQEAEYKYECIVDVKKLRQLKPSSECKMGQGRTGKNVQNIYQRMC